jgi:hypothetical protein
MIDLDQVLKAREDWEISRDNFFRKFKIEQFSRMEKLETKDTPEVYGYENNDTGFNLTVSFKLQDRSIVVFMSRKGLGKLGEYTQFFSDYLGQSDPDIHKFISFVIYSLTQVLKLEERQGFCNI